MPLRPLDTQAVEFLELRDSIQEHGLINPITVRPIRDSPGYFEIVVGLNRYGAHKVLGRKEIACIVKKLSDAEVLALQIAENAVGVPTKPVEYAKHLKRLQKAYPNFSAAQIGRAVGKSAGWVGQQLGLIKLIEPAQLAVDRGEMPLASAYMLSKIPREYQRGFLVQAKTFTSKEFHKVAAEFIRGVMECRRTGQLHKHYLKEFEAQPHLRAVKTLLNELISNQAGKTQVLWHVKNARTNAAKRDAALEGWKLALKWVMHMDDESIEKQKRASIEKQRQQRIERELYVNEIDSDVPDETENDDSDSTPDSQL